MWNHSWDRRWVGKSTLLKLVSDEFVEFRPKIGLFGDAFTVGFRKSKRNRKFEKVQKK